MEQNLVIPQPLAQAVLNYLARQPYADVASLVQALLQLQKVPEPREEPVTD